MQERVANAEGGKRYNAATLLLSVLIAITEDLASNPLDTRALEDVTFTSKQLASGAFVTLYKAQQALDFGRELGILQRRRHSHFFALVTKKGKAE